MIAKLPNRGDIVKMFNCGILKIEVTIEDELFITDMLSRKKYRLVYDGSNFQIILIEQE